MPDLPQGERGLRLLSERFNEVEARIRSLISRAASGDRRELLTEALALLVALRREDFRGPVVAAYLDAFRQVRRGGEARAVKDLAASLALKLDRGAQTAAASAREAFGKVTVDNVDDVAEAAVVAHEARDGTRWPLGAWATMNTETIGRTASTRGLTDAVRTGKVTIDVGECDYCAGFAGEAVIGTDPLPPFHPSCTCTASAA